MLNKNHCDIKSPISVDKKYPDETEDIESFAAKSHYLKNINPDHYSEILKGSKKDVSEVTKEVTKV